MATVAQPASRPLGADWFFFYLSVAMAAVIVAGFSLHLAAGRSSFDAPLVVHLHALVFFGWVVLFLTQSGLAAGGSIALHRRLGWLAAGWIVAMIVLAFALVIRQTQAGTTAFFFKAQHFLIVNPITVVIFAGLTAAAIVNRKHTDWHARLHVCGMALLVGPGFGRLLPLPLVGDYAYQLPFLLGFIFPLIGMWRDWRLEGRIHPAWLWGVGSALLVYFAAELIVVSPLGDAIYAWTTEGTPGAARPGLSTVPPQGS